MTSNETTAGTVVSNGLVPGWARWGPEGYLLSPFPPCAPPPPFPLVPTPGTDEPVVGVGGVSRVVGVSGGVVVVSSVVVVVSSGVVVVVSSVVVVVVSGVVVVVSSVVVVV